ncbi:TonB-dependent receptor [Alistipes onderdonkii]|uniref:TonB-dependent receptor n=1 Tax=Alistipes onderdonkii TaxID=328813 RepID=UPI00210D08E0|nr:TonB-dependent receptor [Alistipes onderdonkii]MCQ4760644.1 TonB-dependent receptor [Alistipes onderdonkii]
MSETLDEISRISGYSFFYYDGLFSSARKVTLKTTNLTIRQTLDKLFEGSENTYAIDGQQVFIRRAPAKKQQAPKSETITGWVLDKNNAPVSGATVIVAGTNKGVTSGIQGGFQLSDITLPATLNISFLGYEPRTVVVTPQNKDQLTVVLNEESKLVDDIVVVGYGTQRRGMVSSAISKMVVDENNQRQVASPGQLLQGRVAGVISTTGSGNLGSAERMSIRGISSISAGNEPLYVIDGIPITNEDANIFNFGETMSSMATIAVNDIESIEVLKDAASAAIYGSRASNGVVLITTKSGREGKATLRLNFQAGISQFPNLRRVKMANSKQYIEAYNEGVDNYNRQYGYQVGDADYQVHIQNPFGTMPDTDWMKIGTQLGRSYNVDVSVSGGNAKTTYYVGGSYNDQTGVIRTNAMRKANLKAKVTQKFAKWLEVGANVSGNYMKNDQIPGSNIGSSILERLIHQRPIDHVYTPGGGYYTGGTPQLTFHNPVQILDEQIAYIENYRILGNFFAKFNFFDDKLQIQANYNADLSFTYDYTYYNENHPYGTGVGRLVEAYRHVPNTTFEVYANYNDKFGDVDFSAMLGHSYQDVTRKQNYVDVRGFPSPSFNIVNAAAEFYNVTGTLNEYAMESYFGRITAGYKDRYMLTATLRTDGSSKFAPENRWGWFPSVSFGWNLGNEPFMEDSGIDLKFRASYGRTGNQEGISPWAYHAKMSGGKNYGGQSGIAVSDFGNRNLRWEKADQYDVGFDLAFLKGKVNMIFDIYQKNTFDLLYNKPVAAHTGTTSTLSNIGSIRNRGVEFTLNTHFNFGKHFSWLSQFNISHNKNIIKSLTGEDIIASNRILRAGEEVGSWYVFEQLGIYQYDGEVPDPQYADGIRAGDVKWRDVNNDGQITDEDRVIQGSSNPKFFGGWNNTFKWKGLRLDVFFTYQYGNKVLAEWMINAARLSHTSNVLASQVENRWTGPGSTNEYPRAIFNRATPNVRNSSRILHDGSFIRLRSLVLGYEFPAAITSKLRMKGLRIYFQGDNLFLISKYPGWDPDVSKDLNPLYYGVDRLTVPQPRMFTFGINITI